MSRSCMYAHAYAHAHLQTGIEKMCLPKGTPEKNTTGASRPGYHTSFVISFSRERVEPVFFEHNVYDDAFV